MVRAVGLCATIDILLRHSASAAYRQRGNLRTGRGRQYALVVERIADEVAVHPWLADVLLRAVFECRQ